MEGNVFLKIYFKKGYVVVLKNGTGDDFRSGELLQNPKDG
jgi:hypothetical protein